MSYTIVTDNPGLVGVTPRQVFINSTDTLATVTTAGYLTPQRLGEPLTNSDLVFMAYNSGANASLFNVSIASTGVITLTAASTSISGSVTNGHIASFNSGGFIVDSGVTVSSVSTAITGVNTLTTQLGSLQQIAVTLNTAAVIAGFATPQILIPAVAGKVAIVHSATVYTASTGNTPFTTGVAPIIQYGSTVHGAGTIAVGAGLVTGDIEAATSQVRTLGPAASAVYTGITNTPVTFSCTTAYAAGTGTSVTFTLVYELISATV